MNQRLANRRQRLRRSGSAGPAARPTELSLRLNDAAEPDARGGIPHGPAVPASGSLINGSPETGRSCGTGGKRGLRRAGDENQVPHALRVLLPLGDGAAFTHHRAGENASAESQAAKINPRCLGLVHV